MDFALLPLQLRRARGVGMPNVVKSVMFILVLQRKLKMTKYYRNILIDQRTSCTTDQATAILLGRRSWDPIYHDQNPDADPEEVHEQFMEWLDISIFEDLMDERDGYLIALDDALGDEENKRNEVQVALCRERIVQCDDTIRRAKLILCDIDDELAKGAQSRLRKNQAATDKSGQVHLTLSSLKEWAKDQNYLAMAIEVSPVQIAPPARNGSEIDEPLLNSKGAMTAKSASSFLITFRVLLEAFLEKAGPQYKSESGSDMNKEAVATLISKMSEPGARRDKYFPGQSVSSIEARFKEVIKASTSALDIARAKAVKL